MAVAITRTIDVKELRHLARLEKSGRVASRMLAIANVLSGMSREMSARLAGMDRQTLRDWVHRFNAGGVDGLRDRKRSGRPYELNEEGRQQLCARVEKGPDPEKDGLVRWRCVDLKAWVQQEYGVIYHENSVSRILRNLGFVRMSVGPVHPSSDPALMEDFKKTFPLNSKKPFPQAPKTSLSNFSFRTKRASVRKAR